MTRLALVACGLTAARLEKLEPVAFSSLTEVNVSENPALGARGLARVLGEGAAGPTSLLRAECRNCGALKAVPLRPKWGPTLVHLDVSLCDLGRAGSESLCEWLGHASALETRARRVSLPRGGFETEREPS